MRQKSEIFELDLREQENTVQAWFRIMLTSPDDVDRGFPPGITIWADRRYHGADLHLTWEQARLLLSELERLISEAPPS
jgi:hypothetical protein